MAPAIVHFLVGAALLLLLAAPLALRYDIDRWGLWLVPIGGLWGLAPDIHHIAPRYRDELYAVHNSPWADLFAFHYTLDRPVVRGMYLESVFGSVLLFLVAAAVLSLCQLLGGRSRLAELSRRRLLAPALGALLATGYAGAAVSVLLLNAGALGTLAAIAGRDGIVVGWLVLAVLATAAGASLAITLEVVVPTRYRTHPVSGTLLGVPLAIAAWLASAFLVPFWMRTALGRSVDLPSVSWWGLLGGLVFGLVFAFYYATVRGAFVTAGSGAAAERDSGTERESAT